MPSAILCVCVSVCECVSVRKWKTCDQKSM